MKNLMLTVTALTLASGLMIQASVNKHTVRMTPTDRLRICAEFCKCLVSSTGDLVCSNVDGKAVFQGSGTFNDQNLVVHTMDENGAQAKCYDKALPKVPGLPDCTQYWVNRTKDYYGDRYPMIQDKLMRVRSK